MKLAIASIALLTTVSLPAAGQQTQTDNSFSWSGRVPQGRWIRVRNLSGTITVGTASGDNVEITATKRWRRGDPSVVRFETKKFGAGEENVLVCALWGERSSCDEHGYRTRGNDSDRGMRNNDVAVEFRVLVPRGVRVAVSNVNGPVSVDGVTSDVEAVTVNGEVDVAGASRVTASSINGNVHARLARLEDDTRMEFTTVNGNVIVELPGDAGADIEMQTVNGAIHSSFEMTLMGRLDPRRIRTHIGPAGGPRIRLHTTNGNVELKRR